MTPTPRFTNIVFPSRRAAATNNQSSGSEGFREEEIQEVKGNGRYIVAGHNVPTTGEQSFKVGDKVAVAYKDFRPVAIVGHQWRRAKFEPIQFGGGDEIQTLGIRRRGFSVFLLLESSTRGLFAVDLAADFGVTVVSPQTFSTTPTVKFCQNDTSVILVNFGLRANISPSGEDETTVLLLKMSRGTNDPKIPNSGRIVVTDLPGDFPKLSLTEIQRFTRRSSDIILRRLSLNFTINSNPILVQYVGQVPQVPAGQQIQASIPGSFSVASTSSSHSIGPKRFGITFRPTSIHCIREAGGALKVFALYGGGGAPPPEDRGLIPFAGEFALDGTTLPNVDHPRNTFTRQTNTTKTLVDSSLGEFSNVVTVPSVVSVSESSYAAMLEAQGEPPSGMGIFQPFFGTGGVWPSTGRRFYRLTLNAGVTFGETSASHVFSVFVSNTSRPVRISVQRKFGTNFKIYRAESASGPFQEVAQTGGQITPTTVFLEDNGSAPIGGAPPTTNQNTGGLFSRPWGKAFQDAAPIYLVDLTAGTVSYRNIALDTTLTWTVFLFSGVFFSVDATFIGTTIKTIGGPQNPFLGMLASVGPPPAIQTSGFLFEAAFTTWIRSPWSGEIAGIQVLQRADATASVFVTGALIHTRDFSTINVSQGIQIFSLNAPGSSFGNINRTFGAVEMTGSEAVSGEFARRDVSPPATLVNLLPFPRFVRNISELRGGAFETIGSIPSERRLTFLRINERQILLNQRLDPVTGTVLVEEPTFIDRLKRTVNIVNPNSKTDFVSIFGSQFGFRREEWLISNNRFFFTRPSAEPPKQTLVALSLQDSQIIITEKPQAIKVVDPAEFPIIVSEFGRIPDTSVIFPKSLENRGNP